MVVFKDGVIMKKSIIATVFAVAAVSVSCTKVPEQGGGISMVFHAGSEALTRTSLAKGNAVVWEPGDAISLFDPSRTNNKFTTEDSGPSADFAGEVSGQGVVYYALYPYNVEAGISASVISTVLPSSQEAEEGGFRTGLNLSVAKSDAQDRLLFKNACALVKFTLGKGVQGIVKAVLQGNDGETLAGPVEIDVSSETPGAAVIEKNGVAAEELELAGTFSAGADYYFVSVPAKLSNGLTLTLLDKEGKVRVRRGASEADLQAGHILDLDTLDSGSFISLEKVDGVYHVYDAPGLVEWADKDDALTGDVVLENDIDMSGIEWTPVGSGMQAGGYSGDFNGGGKSICGLEVNTDVDAGFFGGLASGAKVHDLRFCGSKVTGGSKSYAGIVAGASLGVIENCVVSDSQVSGNYAGAIAGNNSVQVNRCDAVGVSVTGTFSAGGIAGLSYGKIEYCTLSGGSRIVASGGSSRAGGIVGSTSEEGGVKTSGRVLKCAVEGAFVSGVWAGGVAGENGFGIIAQCVVDGVTLTHASSESNARIGGIAGYNSRGDVVASYSAYSKIGAEGLVSEAEGGVVGYNNNSSANVYGCYSTHVSLLGTVSGDESGKGCIAGYTNGNVTSCYAVLPEGVDGIGLVGRYSGPAPDHCVAPGHKDYDMLVTGVSDLQADDGSVWRAAEIWNIPAAGTPEIVSDYVCNPPAAQMTETGAAAASRPDNSM